MLQTAKKPRKNARSLLSVLLALISLAAAGLLVQQQLGGSVVVGGVVQHADPAAVSAPGPLTTASLSADDARAAGDPGPHTGISSPETCGDLTGRARVCSPSIGVDAALEPVGTDGAGAMVVPTHADRAAIGWYEESAPVGAAQGNAVLAGHVDHPAESPALGTLHTARPGQKLWVSDGAGAVHSYTVVAVREPTPRTALPQDVFELTGEPGLSLITCSGDYVRPDGSPTWSYTNNLVVDLALDPQTAPVP
ncbi:class F sortase [Kocuria flava]|uniref:class F sortase n=1 Tax=Kocuria flava TaxID=446860 RepID=UPI001FF63BD8|nr:class F sortase [Kocuria flava]MCJ8503644.1 class F sortase [Kocuria flava]